MSDGSAPCTGSVSGWSASGGTSFTAPIFAGIQALVNQYTGSAQGLPNYVYYKIAAAEYGASGNSGCNSSNGNAVNTSCIFYDVTLGDDNAPCKADTNGRLYNCYLTRPAPWRDLAPTTIPTSRLSRPVSAGISRPASAR